MLKKAASVGYRTGSRLFSSASAEDSIEPLGDTTKPATKQTKQRWPLQLFGVKVRDIKDYAAIQVEFVYE